jgi:hypothetical protein
VANKRATKTPRKILIAQPVTHQTTNSNHYKAYGSEYDTDFFPILLDNHASKCLTNNLQDFLGTPTPTRARIKGIGGARVQATYKGTVRWSFADDDGRVHDFLLPDTYYSPGIPG